MTLFKKNKMGVVRLVFLMLLPALCQTVSAQQSTFIQLEEGAPIEVLSLKMAAVAHKELNGESGPPARNITIEKSQDGNSAMLFLRAATGEPFLNVTVYINGAQFKFSTVFVAGYFISDGTGIETVVLQTFDLNPRP